MLSAELRIRLDQDDAFRPLSEKLQRLIDEKRAGTLAGIALIEELEKLTEAVRAAVEEANRPVAQQLALKVKARNAAITDALAAEIAVATLTEADKHCFPVGGEAARSIRSCRAVCCSWLPPVSRRQVF